MFILITVKILLLTIVAVYAWGLFVVWHYENRKAKMYMTVIARIEFLQNLGMNTALVHAKTFKIKCDYRKWIEMINGRQRFISEKVLFLKKVL